ncbi:hypothetical protein Hypma_014958 [Hypsizygus marmoreus]|uniref:F-box domain-containing protein n=1 Tax=Hypsizygus marmoreus TaxID=39966 RepID=A0A369KCM1_HYPMA|nr:hypothetical protein Hypma_014958 [Hypsizygus marmoreus]
MFGRWKYRHVAVSLAWMRPYVSRIRHLSLQGSLCELPVGVFDALETLEFTDVDLKETDFPDNGFGATPLLRRLVFTQAFVQLPFLSLFKLTDLRLNTGEEDPISESVLLRFLSRCNALVTLYVSCIIKDDIDAYGEGEDAIPFDRWEDGKISMLHLTSLTVGLFDQTFWLLSYLVLPVLSCLTIDSATGWSQAIYRSFLYQSSPPLRTLVLQGSLMREDAFLDLLRHTPSLVHVTVTNSIHITSTLIEGMAWGADDATLGIGPCLETMHIEDSHWCTAADTEWLCNGAITEMISSRDSSGNPAVLVENSQTESTEGSWCAYFLLIGAPSSTGLFNIV